jgi:hypothetical protein
MTTGKKAAHSASKLLRSKKSSAPVKKVAGSDLSQSKHHKKKK